MMVRVKMQVLLECERSIHLVYTWYLLSTYRRAKSYDASDCLRRELKRGTWNGHNCVMRVTQRLGQCAPTLWLPGSD